MLVLLQRPLATWKPTEPAPNSKREDYSARPLPVSDFLDVIEQALVLIDTESGRVIAELPLPGVLMAGFLDPSRLYGFEPDDDGLLVPIVLRVILEP